MSTSLGQQVSAEDSAIWDRLAEGEQAFLDGYAEFRKKASDRVALIRRALRGRDRIVALLMLRWLESTELQDLFEDLVLECTTLQGLGAVHEAILSLPREWVLEHFERAAEPVLADGDADDYAAILDLCRLLDRNLAIQVSHRAVQQSDESIAQVGIYMMDMLKYYRVLEHRRARLARADSSPQPKSVDSEQSPLPPE